jgi:hypothetical protein
MSRARAFADQDGVLWEATLTANTGASPILRLENIFDGVKNRKQFSRIIVRFGLSSLTGSIVNDKKYPDPRTDSTVTAYLYMFNAPHGDEQARSFDINVHPLTQTWAEGSGLDMDTLTETGFAHALSAETTVAWTTTGGTYQVDPSSATMKFNHGEENLKVDVTTIFKDWMDGNSANEGLILKMTDNQEIKTGALSAVSIHTKKFYARETNTTKQPYIQLEWDGSINDFRNFVEFNSSADLFFYNIKNGQLADLNGTGPFPGNVTLSGLSGSSYSGITTSLTAARHSKGVYRANTNVFPLTANEYSAYKDNWFLSASPTANYTFDFTAINPASGFDNFVTSQYRISFQNLREHYDKGSIARVRVHIKDDKTTLEALTAGTTAVDNFIVTNGTYEIRETRTDHVEQSAVNVSYDTNGNFFEIDTNNLYPNIEYKIVLNLWMRGEKFVYDYPNKWNFVVV